MAQMYNRKLNASEVEIYAGMTITEAFEKMVEAMSEMQRRIDEGVIENILLGEEPKVKSPYEMTPEEYLSLPGNVRL